jgi:hypothetical protein
LRSVGFDIQWEGRSRPCIETDNCSLVIEYSRRGMFDNFPIVTIRVSNESNFSLAIVRFDGRRRAIIESQNFSGLKDLQLTDYQKIVRWLRTRETRQKTWKLTIQAQSA